MQPRMEVTADVLFDAWVREAAARAVAARHARVQLRVARGWEGGPVSHVPHVTARARGAWPGGPGPRLAAPAGVMDTDREFRDAVYHVARFLKSDTWKSIAYYVPEARTFFAQRVHYGWSMLTRSVEQDMGAISQHMFGVTDPSAVRAMNSVAELLSDARRWAELTSRTVASGRAHPAVLDMMRAPLDTNSRAAVWAHAKRAVHLFVSIVMHPVHATHFEGRLPSVDYTPTLVHTMERADPALNLNSVDWFGAWWREWPDAPECTPHYVHGHGTRAVLMAALPDTGVRAAMRADDWMYNAAQAAAAAGLGVAAMTWDHAPRLTPELILTCMHGGASLWTRLAETVDLMRAADIQLHAPPAEDAMHAAVARAPAPVTLANAVASAVRNWARANAVGMGLVRGATEDVAEGGYVGFARPRDRRAEVAAELQRQGAELRQAGRLEEAERAYEEAVRMLQTPPLSSPKVDTPPAVCDIGQPDGWGGRTWEDEVAPVPGAPFAGPGTKIRLRLERGGSADNVTDSAANAAAVIHDMRYAQIGGVASAGALPLPLVARMVRQADRDMVRQMVGMQVRRPWVTGPTITASVVGTLGSVVTTGLMSGKVLLSMTWSGVTGAMQATARTIGLTGPSDATRGAVDMKWLGAGDALVRPVPAVARAEADRLVAI